MNIHRPISSRKRARRAVNKSASFDEAFVLDHFDDESCDDQIRAHETARYEAQHPDNYVTKIEVEAVSEELTHHRSEKERANVEKARADLTTERQVTGKREFPLTLHEWHNYFWFFVASLLGVFVATYALAIYAAESGVIIALDNSLFAAVMMAFPVFSASQALKAVGGLQKNDATKTLYFSRLAKLGAIAFVILVFGAVLTFAPKPTDLSAVASSLTSGETPPTNLLVSVCKALAPYLTIGGGLVSEIAAAAVIGHRADGIDAKGRLTVQNINVTQELLDARIAWLRPQIEACAKKLGRLQAEVARHEAGLAARIEAAQARARELRALYAAHEARSRHDFRSQLTKQGD